MNWKKRKKQRRIAHHYGFAHYYEYKRSLRFYIYYTAFEHALNNCLIHWSEVLPRMNQMFCKAGLPEYCMTQEEWYAKVMAKHSEMEEELARKEDEMIIRIINKHYSDFT